MCLIAIPPKLPKDGTNFGAHMSHSTIWEILHCALRIARLISDARWPWEKKALFFGRLIPCKGEPFPPKKRKNRATGQQSHASPVQKLSALSPVHCFLPRVRWALRPGGRRPPLQRSAQVSRGQAALSLSSLKWGTAENKMGVGQN